ncbi:hypothetical protein I4F81_006422 [Pyropia yezoensis]|uniref:Uncharacterized protein n=1 Tax=Pyropia yezoensis TaxID=2788 RepID=A0ACC3C259_PYRYE|nr:hypothetical protein I4F81_006422 [Neopyropia yezoensis]
MPSHERGKQLPLEDQAATLVRDLRLIWEHAAYLVSLLGSVRWLVTRRYDRQRPQSEMKLSMFGGDVLYIFIAGILSFPVAGALIGSVLLALVVYMLGDAAGGPATLGPAAEIFRFPLRSTLWVLRQVLDVPIFDATPLSPIGDAVNAGRPLRVSQATLDAAVSVGGDDGHGAAAGPKDVKGPDVKPAVPAVVGPDETWLFVNGIVETRAMARATAERVSALTGRNVTVMYNGSLGMGMDMAECLLGRTLDTSSRPSEDLANRVQEQLALGRLVVLLGHSQGGIIVSNAVRMLVARAAGDAGVLESLRRLEVYTFASAADEMRSAVTADGTLAPYAEHFCAEWDAVSRMGSLTFSGWLPRVKGVDVKPDTWNGRVHVLRAKGDAKKREEDWQGHLLKEHLWPALLAGAFGVDSVFMTKYGVNREAEKTKDT